MNIQLIRDNSHLVKLNQRNRFADDTIIDNILKYDQQFREADYKCNQLYKLKNILNNYYKNATDSEITKLTDDTTIIVDNLLNNKLDLSNLTKNQLNFIGKCLNLKLDIENKIVKKSTFERDRLISQLGNILYKETPIYKDEKDNVIIYQKNIPNEFLNKKYDHNDLCRMLDCVDTETGSKISGDRGYFLTGWGVKLNLALINYALDFLDKKKYKLISTPHMVTKEFMSKITQLTDYEETLYKLEDTNKYLIATSEQPLTAYFSNKHIAQKDLPMKVAGISTCYRKETGAHGKQTRGIFRVHQFEKVEQFCVADCDNSWDIFHEMINNTKEFYDSLGIYYRIVNIVSGALNNSASMKYDLEAWFPGSKFYGELVSCTNCLDYFSKKLNVKRINDKKYLHMLNCTLCANTRVLTCLLETNQTEKGFIVPEVLRKYVGTDFIEFKKIN